jgi:hypothetical protein
MKPSPLCWYEKGCPFKGTVIYGKPRDLGECVNRSMRCERCGRTGEESVRKDLA